MGTEFLGPGGGQGLLDSLVNAFSAPRGLVQWGAAAPAADAPIGAADTLLLSLSVVFPVVPASLWAWLIFANFRVDATLADTLILSLAIDGAPLLEWDALVGAGSVTSGFLAQVRVGGGNHSLELRGQSALGAGNCVLKKVSGGGVPTTRLGSLLLPGRQS